MSDGVNLAGDRIRAVLQQNFGNTKFRVRRHDRSMVTCYVITWTDGPAEDDVQLLTLPYVRDVPFGSIYCVRLDGESDLVFDRGRVAKRKTPGERTA